MSVPKLFNFLPPNITVCWSIRPMLYMWYFHSSPCSYYSFGSLMGLFPTDLPMSGFLRPDFPVGQWFHILLCSDRFTKLSIHLYWDNVLSRVIFINLTSFERMLNWNWCGKQLSFGNALVNYLEICGWSAWPRLIVTRNDDDVWQSLLILWSRTSQGDVFILFGLNLSTEW